MLYFIYTMFYIPLYVLYIFYMFYFIFFIKSPRHNVPSQVNLGVSLSPTYGHSTHMQGVAHKT